MWELDKTCPGTDAGELEPCAGSAGNPVYTFEYETRAGPATNPPFDWETVEVRSSLDGSKTCQNHPMSSRIAVIGNSGSGKSTLSRSISSSLGCDHVELDRIHHLENWTPIERDEMRSIVSDRIEADCWVVDGNYRSFVGDLVLPRADTVVWLDLPRRVVMSRIIRRTLTRMVTRRELWNGNRERFANLFKTEPEENIILWAWTQHDKYHQRYLEAMNNPDNGHLTWVQLTSPQQVRTWLATLA